MRRDRRFEGRDTSSRRGDFGLKLAHQQIKQPTGRIFEILDRPISDPSCLVGWVVASAVYLWITSFLGGPIEGDAAESAYSTWSIAHGNLACAYPPASSFGFPNIAHPYALVAPFYALFSGALAALFHIGNSVPFPSPDKMGPHCSHALSTMFKWSIHASAIGPTIRLSYFVWLILMVGTITFIRASGKGRRLWEPATLIVLAILPTVFMAVGASFHPQDLAAMGFVLASLAAFIRKKWLLAGVLIGLALTTQQFALLAFAPLLVVASSNDRWRFIIGTVVAVFIIDLPLVIASSGRAINTSLLGSSRLTLFGSAKVVSAGGTILFSLGIHGVAAFLLSRVLPVCLAIALAYWASRQLDRRIMEPAILSSLVAISLCFRLVFEVNLFGYYFMAVSIMMLLIDVIQGRIAGLTVGWIALTTLAFNPIPWGFASNWTTHGRTIFEALPFAFIGVALAALVVQLLRHRVHWTVFAWIVLVILTCVHLVWGEPLEVQFMPFWVWQLILVPSALVLVSRPMRVAWKQLDGPMPQYAPMSGNVEPE